MSGTRLKPSSISLVAEGDTALPVTTVIDPAGSAAVSTAIIDDYSGVIIKLNLPGNTQTLQNPSDMTATKRFTIIADDNNGIHTVVVNTINLSAQPNSFTLSAGEAIRFIWDGSAWIVVGAVTAKDIVATPHETITAIDVQDYLDDLEDGKMGNEENFQNYIGSPMVITGGEITNGTNAGTFKVATLIGLLRTADSAIGTLAIVIKAVQDNIAITLADTLYYVVLNYNAGTPTISLITTLGDFYDKISLGSVMKDASNKVYYISGCHRLRDGVSRLHFRAFEIYGLYLTEGNTIAYSGTNNFTLTAGVVYEGINRLTQIAYDSAITTFIPVYQNGSGGWTEGAARNTIDFAHYDDGDGTLGEIGNAKFGCHWVFRHVDSAATVYVLYGRGSYAKAEAEVTDVPTKPDHLTNFGCLIGRIVAKESGGEFVSIDMVSDTRFIGQAVATHNVLGGLNEGDYRHLTHKEKTNLDDGVFTTLSASTDPVNEHGIGDVGFNDGRYLPKILDIVIASSNGNVATSTMNGGVEKITGSYTRTLPTLVPGMNALFRASTAAVFSIKAGASCHFEMFDGTILDNGDKITSGGTKNESIHIICEVANVGIVINQNGSMFDGGV